jgi:hypothetical protein
MTVDIQKFCADEYGFRDYLKKPFSKGDFTYATNAHIAVEIPRVAGAPEFTEVGAPDVDKLIKASAPLRDMRSLPAIRKAGEHPKCEQCNGLGAVAQCNSCMGSGRASPVSDDDCADCRGDGEIPVHRAVSGSEICFSCDGSGLSNHWREIVRVSRSVFLDAKYVRLIASLPNARLAFSVDQRDIPVPFTFDGGRGWVMQVRGDEFQIDLCEPEAA